MTARRKKKLDRKAMRAKRAPRIRKAKDAVVPVAKPPAPKPVERVTQPRIDYNAAIVRARSGKRDNTRDPEFDPFAPYVPPAAVVPKNWKPQRLAMDSAAITALSPSWSAINGIFNQGWTFMGYAALSELAQIPEYRVISEIIGTEATRKWIEFQATGDLEPKESKAKAEKIRLLEDAMVRFAVRDHFKKLAVYDGFMGRSHLYIDLGNEDDRDELLTPIGDGRASISRAKVRKGKLKGFKVVEPIWTYPANYNANDPLRDDWYNPTTWFVMAKEIHTSRLLRFVGREVPDILKPAYAFGGLSLSQMAKPYVDNWLRTRQSVADIVHAFSVMVLATDLQTSLHADGDQLFKRIDLFNALRDNKGLMAINKDTEEFDNVSAPLGTLDMLQAQTQEHMAAVSRIPTVKLLGIQPAGLNASSDGEIRVFEDSIHAYQESFFRPNLTTVINFIQLSEFGEVDESITYKFVPLHTLSEKEEAEVQKAKADTHQVYVDMGAIGQEEVRKSVAADPDTPYPGLDVDDLPEDPDAELPENIEGEPVGARKILAGPAQQREKEAA